MFRILDLISFGPPVHRAGLLPRSFVPRQLRRHRRLVRLQELLEIVEHLTHSTQMLDGTSCYTDKAWDRIFVTRPGVIG